MITLKKIKNYYDWGGRFLTDSFHLEAKKQTEMEIAKTPYRYDIINFILTSFKRETSYLEIGVRNPEINFNKINSKIKYSVDPGLEFKTNPVDFKVTSDDFFDGLRNGKYLTNDVLFDVIFIDGLHLAEQVDLDIKNALEFIKEDGFIVLHDCNPPTEWHAREKHKYEISPALSQWNGTTWKGYLKWRSKTNLFSCTIDTDWGVGVISKVKNIGQNNTIPNEFFEFSVLEQNRTACLNLISFEEFKNMF